MNTTIEIDEEEIEVEVDFNYYKGDPGVWTYSNGDPGYPTTGPECEIISIIGNDGIDYIDKLTPAQYDLLHEEIFEYVAGMEPDFD